MPEKTETFNTNSSDAFLNPFKGADSYAETDTLNFYGRDGERSDLINLVEQNTLTLLYSRSGIGKSSLINAGLIPVLKKSIFYFPVYIRLSDEMISTEVKTFSEAVVKIIKEEAEKRKVTIGVKEESNVFIRNNPSITEFLYFSEFISNVNEKVIPVIIFDQFEEIFSRQFHKASIIDLIDDLSYAIESKMPDDLSWGINKLDKDKDLKSTGLIFGADIFKNCNAVQAEEELNNLRNNLQQNLKDYRFLFSFRDEYLPRFESLINKLPSIFKMSGRLNLQTFSVSLASNVINRISKASLEINKTLCDHLAGLISNSDKKFESSYFGVKDEVQPFLLSLVCKKLYPEIVGSNANRNTIERIEKEDYQIVDNIVSEYTKEIFSKVSRKTRKFVEEELITENEKRKLFPLSEVEDAEIRVELNDLSKEQNLRYLNVVQYFNSSNIEILHDRLLKPLVESRNKRRKQESVYILEEQKKKMEEENKVAAVRRRNRFLLIAGVAAIAGFLILYMLLNSYDPFLKKINSVRLEKLSSEIPQNSIGALINVAEYQQSVDSIGNIEGLDLLPDFADPLKTTKNELNKEILDYFKTKPVFFSFPDTANTRSNVSPKGNFKFTKTNSAYKQKSEIKFYRLKNDTFPSYVYFGKVSVAENNQSSQSSYRTSYEYFSPDEKYFIYPGKGYVLTFEIQKISEGNTVPVDSIALGKNFSFLKFSFDSKLLLFKKEDDKNIEYFYSAAGEGKKGQLKKIQIPENTNFSDVYAGEDNKLVYITYGRNDGFLILNEKKSTATLLTDVLKILDLNTSQITDSITSETKNLTNVGIVENDKQLMVSNKHGEVEILDNAGRKPLFKTKFENFDSTIQKTTYYNNLQCFGSEFDDKILLGYNNEFRVYDLSKKESDPDFRNDFGFLRMNVRYAYFNRDTSVTFIDSRGNIIKWYYEKKSPDDINQLKNYSSIFTKIYGDKNFLFVTEFLGIDSSSNRSWLNRMRWN